MKRKTVEVLMYGGRYPVKGWGIAAIPGVSLTALYKLGTGGEVEVSDSHTVALVHDHSGLCITFYRGGVKGLEAFVAEWAGGGVDWTKTGQEVVEQGQGAQGKLIDLIHGTVRRGAYETEDSSG